MCLNTIVRLKVEESERPKFIADSFGLARSSATPRATAGHP